MLNFEIFLFCFCDCIDGKTNFKMLQEENFSVLTDACNTLIGQDSRPTLKKNETKLSQNLTKNEKQKKIIKIYKKGREKKFNIKKM